MRRWGRRPPGDRPGVLDAAQPPPPQPLAPLHSGNAVGSSGLSGEPGVGGGAEAVCPHGWALTCGFPWPATPPRPTWAGFSADDQGGPETTCAS